MGLDKFFCRTYKLTLTRNGSDLVLESTKDSQSFDIKFNVRFSSATICRSGRVSVLGLSLDTMLPYLNLSSMSTGSAMEKLLKVKLEAGYGGDNITIIDGYAHSASISQPPPNLWIDIEVSENSVITKELHNEPFTEPTQISAIASAVLEKFGLSFEYAGNNPSMLETKTIFPGRMMDVFSAISEVERLAPWKLAKFGNTVKAYDVGPDPGGAGEKTFSEQEGLLTVSGITCAGCSIMTFLQDPAPNDFFTATVNSQIYKGINGTEYWINEKEFRGHYTGTEWYSIFHGIAK